MKIPFTLEAWLKDKSQSVETRDGRIVHNIWRVKEPTYTNNRKIEICALIDGEEDAIVFFEGGRYLPTTRDTDSPFDLFIITPEPELSEFEKKLSDVVGYAISLSVAEPQKPTSEFVKEYAAELLALARKELCEQIVDHTKEAYENGKAKALKDLPRWKKAHDHCFVGPAIMRDESGFYHASTTKPGCRYITYASLSALPGFKED